jgi:glycine/D-amino acid oxidase-like deaminating enzyme
MASAAGRRADLTVMGAGVFGLSVAFECARRGARVRVVETARVGAGASGGLVGALAPHAPDGWDGAKAFQLESLLLAPGFWAEVTATGGLSAGFGAVGRLAPLADDRAVAQARARAGQAAQHWPGAAWEVVVCPGGPWAPVSPSGLMVRDTLTARLDPRRALAALVAAVQALGGEVAEGAVDAGPGPVVWATGAAGLAALSAALGRPVGRGEKGQAARLAVAAPPGTPVVQGRGLWVVPHADGTVAVGSTSEAGWADMAPDAMLDAVLEQARALVPALAGAEVIERWAGIRPRSATRLPVLGAWPGRGGHFVANGGFKTGFGLAPLVAQIMADLVLDGRAGVPDWARLAP